MLQGKGEMLTYFVTGENPVQRMQRILRGEVMPREAVSTPSYRSGISYRLSQNLSPGMPQESISLPAVVEGSNSFKYSIPKHLGILPADWPSGNYDDADSDQDQDLSGVEFLIGTSTLKKRPGAEKLLDTRCWRSSSYDVESGDVSLELNIMTDNATFSQEKEACNESQSRLFCLNVEESNRVNLSREDSSPNSWHPQNKDHQFVKLKEDDHWVVLNVNDLQRTDNHQPAVQAVERLQFNSVPANVNDSNVTKTTKTSNLIEENGLDDSSSGTSLDKPVLQKPCCPVKTGGL